MPAGRGGKNHFASIPKRAVSTRARQPRNVEGAGHESEGDRRKYAARKNFGQKVCEKSRASQPRPPHLSIPDFGRAAVTKRLREGPIDEPDLETGVANDLGRCCVLGDFLTQCFDPAGTF